MQEEANLQGDDLGGRGVFLVGVCCPVLQIPTYHRPKRGEAGHGVRISLSMLALGWDFFPGEGIFESFFTRRVLIDNGTGPLLDIL